MKRTNTNTNTNTTPVGVPGALKLLIPATGATGATSTTDAPSRALTPKPKPQPVRYLKYDDIQAKACIIEMDADDCDCDRETLLAYVALEAYLKLTRRDFSQEAVPDARVSQYGLVMSIVTPSHIYFEYKGE